MTIVPTRSGFEQYQPREQKICDTLTHWQTRRILPTVRPAVCEGADDSGDEKEIRDDTARMAMVILVRPNAARQWKLFPPFTSKQINNLSL